MRIYYIRNPTYEIECDWKALEESTYEGPQVWRTGSKTGWAVTGDMGEIDMRRASARRGKVIPSTRNDRNDSQRSWLRNKWPVRCDICQMRHSQPLFVVRYVCNAHKASCKVRDRYIQAMRVEEDEQIF